MDNACLRDFSPQTMDKVERLLDLLEELGEHPALRDKFALHGGTAEDRLHLHEQIADPSDRLEVFPSPAGH